MRIAIAGFGFMGATHARALAGVPGLELAALCVRDPSTVSTAVRGNLDAGGAPLDISGVPIETDFERLLADPSLDAVDLCLPTPLHAPAACAALRAGKHVLVEKPMAASESDLQAMLEAASASGRVLMVAHVLRFFPAYQALAHAVESKEFGEPRAVRFRRKCAAPDWAPWFADPARSGGAPLDLLIHDIDMALHLFGPPEAAQASGRRDLARGIDLLAAQLSYPGGPVVSVDGGWHGRGGYPFSMGFTAVFDDAVLELAGELTLYQAPAPPRVLPTGEANGYAAELDYFARCCRAGEFPALCPPEESARAVRLALLLDEARRESGEWKKCRI